MVSRFDTHDLGRHYPELLDDLREARLVDTRGGRTREIVDFSLVLRDPTRCIVDRDSFSRRFMDAEIAMLLAGTYDAELLRAITPRAADLTTSLTAYGPRVRHQLPLIVQELRDDPASRRAVAYVGASGDLAGVGASTAGEMPCTMTWQFLIRPMGIVRRSDTDALFDDLPTMTARVELPRLHMIVNMRSNDAVWGLTYDVPCFVAVQMAVAKALRVPLGDYIHHAGSFHLYERHWETKARPTDERLELEWICDEFEETVKVARTMVDIMRAGATKQAMEAQLRG